MKKPERTSEQWRVICGILAVILLIAVWQWYRSENARVNLAEELQEKNATIEMLEEKLRRSGD